MSANKFQTMTFDADDVLLAATWAKAEALYRRQMEILGRYFKWDEDPLAWAELGLDCRMSWWDQALIELRLAPSGAADYAGWTGDL